MNILHIYSGSIDKEIPLLKNHKVSSYNLGMGKALGPGVVNINDAKLLNKIALKNVEIYSEFVYSQNKKFIKNQLTVGKKLSLYFLSDFSCKRSELFSTYSDYCNILLIKDYCKNNAFNKIIIEETSFEFSEALRSIIGETPLEIINLDTNKFQLSKIFFKNILFFIKVGFGVWISKCFINRRSSQKNSKIESLFLTRYPLHLDCNLKEDKYGKFSENKSFLVNIFTDDFHQKIGFMEFLRSLKHLSSFNKVYVLDHYLLLSDIWKSFISTFFISKGIKKLCNEKYILNDINLSFHIKNELLFSIMRIPRLLMWQMPIIRFFDKYEIASLYYYLHEYPYGRIFTYVVSSKFPQTRLVGFQHGPSSKRKMLYMLAKNELKPNQNSFFSFSMPDKVMAEDKYSADIYRDSGYKNVELMKKIYRLSYLSSIKRDSIEMDTSIIAPGLHDGLLLMNILKKKILNNRDKKFILKVHPRADNRYTRKFKYLDNLSISKEDISVLLSKVGKVYATYSSVAIEAALLKIDVEIVDLPGKINESPLYDKDFIKDIDNLKY